MDMYRECNCLKPIFFVIVPLMLACSVFSISTDPAEIVATSFASTLTAEAEVSKRVEATVEALQHDNQITGGVVNPPPIETVVVTGPVEIVTETVNPMEEVPEMPPELPPTPLPFTPHPTSLPMPTDTPARGPVQARVVMYFEDSEYGFYNLAKVAENSGVDLMIFEGDLNSYLNVVNMMDVATAVYASAQGGPSVDALLRLLALVNRGGRIVLFYDSEWAWQNDVLQELFSLSVMPELLKLHSDTFPESEYWKPDGFPAYSYGVTHAGFQLALTAYLEVPGSGGERHTVTSDTTGQTRLIYYSNPAGNIIFWPQVALETDREGTLYGREWFFDDGNIWEFDNALAASRLVKFLTLFDTSLLTTSTATPTLTNIPTATAIAIFEDHFSTDKGWVNNTSGDFYRDTTNQCLSWHVHRSTDEYYYIPISSYSGDFRLEARVKATYWANNNDLYFGLVEERNNPWPTGAFVAFGYYGGVGSRIHPRITFADGSSPVGWDASDPSTYIQYSQNIWYRVVLEIISGTWSITVYDETDNQVGQLTGTMPSSHSAYNYVMLFNPNDGDWPTGDGLFDDLMVESLDSQ